MFPFYCFSFKVYETFSSSSLTYLFIPTEFAFTRKMRFDSSNLAFLISNGELNFYYFQDELYL